MTNDDHAKWIDEYTAGYAHSHVDAYTPSTRTGYFYLLRQELVADELSRVPSGGRLLDIGCGVGHASRIAALYGFDYHGVDISGEMIEVARTVRSNHDATFALGSVANLEFESDSFDVVLALGILEYVEANRLDEAMQEISRVLRPNGVLVASLLNGSSPMWRSQRIREWIREAMSAFQDSTPRARAPEIFFTSRQVQDLFARSGLSCRRSTIFSFALLPSRLFDRRPEGWTKICRALEVVSSTPLCILGMAHLVIAAKPSEK